MPDLRKNFVIAQPLIAQCQVLCMLIGLSLLLTTGCNRLTVNDVQDRLRPSNNRDWKPEQASMPFAEIHGSQYKLKNIRNCSYVSVNDYVVGYEERTIDISDIQSVDFIVVPFLDNPLLAHTMLSFGFRDGSYLAVSVEVRKEKGEEYSSIGGFQRKYEIIYVLGDERDLIRVRTGHWGNDVYVYPTVAGPELSRELFADIVTRMNKLLAEPEFYHTVTNNCTTNLKDHVNRIRPHRLQDSWQVLLPGFSAKYAYDSGLLDNRIPFENLESIAYVNDLAKLHFDDPRFSQLIRSRRELIKRHLAREETREPILQARGGQYLDETLDRQAARFGEFLPLLRR
jgi:hypothetical protein